MGSTTAVSPLAPTEIVRAPALSGVRFATAEAGIRYKNRRDVFLCAFAPGTTVAGVFTRSRCPSAPVDWCRAILPRGTARALLVNSGNANAFTGAAGRTATHRTAELAAAALGCGLDEVFLASTGVIGEPLDAEKYAGVMAGLVADARPGDWQEAARAIMTTDTFPKVAARTITLDGTPVSLVGIAKGAGMIAPDMATMLAFVFTDAVVPAAVLQGLLKPAADASFNAVTVDGDTSTSDTLLAFATGQAAMAPLAARGDRRTARFARALREVLVELAQLVARDGEGATKFVTIDVTGAVSARSAKRIAKAIADSPLVKTAIAGEDANWGRVVMAVGKAGEPADRDRLAIAFNGVPVASGGARHPGYDEAQTSAVMKAESISIAVDLGLGRGRARVWTCDLTHGYIDVNGSYRS